MIDKAVETLRSLKGIEIVVVALGLCSLVAPGIATVWHFFPSYITELSTPKLVLLGVTITICPLTVNSTLSAVIDSIENPDLDRAQLLFNAFLGGAILTMASFFSGFVFLAMGHPGPRSFITAAAFMDGLFFALLLIPAYMKRTYRRWKKRITPPTAPAASPSPELPDEKA